jgi:predicted nucleic acid-binding protein
MEKLKIYLDTNTIIDFFINQAKALKTGSIPIVPEKLKFFLANADKIEFITSVATEAEIARELIGGLKLNEDQFNRLWNKFLKELGCHYVKEFNLDQQFSQMPKKYSMRLRTLVNFIHLFIAIKENAYIVTGDKDLIKLVRENKLYDKILSYIELRKIISSVSQGS